jgi:hypothetical protein
MTTIVSKHKITTLRQYVNRFNDFTVYMFVGVDAKGNQTCVEFYHHDEDTLVCEPVEHKDYRTEDRKHEDVTPTL